MVDGLHIIYFWRAKMEAAVQWTFYLAFFLSFSTNRKESMYLPCLYFTHSCTKCRPRLLPSESEATTHETVYMQKLTYSQSRWWWSNNGSLSNADSVAILLLGLQPAGLNIKQSQLICASTSTSGFWQCSQTWDSHSIQPRTHTTNT